MIKPGLFICLTLFLIQFFPGTAKPEIAVGDIGFDEIEITGLFRWAASQWFPFPFVIQALCIR